MWLQISTLHETVGSEGSEDRLGWQGWYQIDTFGLKIKSNQMIVDLAKRRRSGT